MRPSPRLIEECAGGRYESRILADVRGTHAGTQTSNDARRRVTMKRPRLLTLLSIALLVVALLVIGEGVLHDDGRQTDNEPTMGSFGNDDTLRQVERIQQV